jgi:microcystin-dependent protein
MTFCVPDLAGVANREIRRDLRARLGLVKGAKDATPSAAAPATTTAASSATASSATASARAAAACSRAAAACSSATAACSRAAAAAATPTAATAGGEGGRGERETSDQQSTAERQNQTAALLVIELKKSAHREILPIEIRSR